MKNIYLVRHAQSQSNAELKLTVNQDIALTETGHKQAQALADWLLHTVEKIDSVFVSTYQRTHATALPLLDQIHLSPVVWADLHEFNYLNFARIQDCSFSQVRAIATDYWQTYTPTDVDGAQLSVPKSWQAESFSDFVQRVQRTVQRLHALPEGNYVVYTHGMWLCMLIWLSLGYPTKNNADMQRFRQFELLTRPKNCEVFCARCIGDMLAITKVRTLFG